MSLSHLSTHFIKKQNFMNPLKGFIFLFLTWTEIVVSASSHLPHTIRYPRAVMVELFHTSLTYGTVLRSNRSYYLKRRYLRKHTKYILDSVSSTNMHLGH